MKTFGFTSLAILLMLLLPLTAAASSVSSQATCTHKSSANYCSAISVLFHRGVASDHRNMGKVGTVCLMGNCRKTKMVNFGQAPCIDGCGFVTNFSSIGPYRCNSKTTTKLIFKGTYVRHPKIYCSK